jgi:hypothetical protein
VPCPCFWDMGFHRCCSSGNRTTLSFSKIGRLPRTCNPLNRQLQRMADCVFLLCLTLGVHPPDPCYSTVLWQCFQSRSATVLRSPTRPYLSLPSLSSTCNCSTKAFSLLHGGGSEIRYVCRSFDRTAPGVSTFLRSEKNEMEQQTFGIELSPPGGRIRE